MVLTKILQNLLIKEDQEKAVNKSLFAKNQTLLNASFHYSEWFKTASCSILKVGQLCVEIVFQEHFLDIHDSTENKDCFTKQFTIYIVAVSPIWFLKIHFDQYHLADITNKKDNDSNKYCANSKRKSFTMWTKTVEKNANNDHNVNIIGSATEVSSS